MTERCVDASVAVKWAVTTEPLVGEAMRLLQDSASAGVILIAPSLFITEVDSTIRKRAYQGHLTADEAKQAYAVLDAAPIHILDAISLRHRARAIAEQFNQRQVYDSVYAALAESRGCEFWKMAANSIHRIAALIPLGLCSARRR